MKPSRLTTRSSRLGTRFVCVLLAAGWSLVAAGEDGRTPSSPELSEKIERGKYLVTVATCNDCHTPYIDGPNGPEPDMSRMLSGHPETFVVPPPPVLPEGPWTMTVAGTNTAWSGPWGVSFTANLTPHRETGLGKWTVRTFIDTIRNGRHLGRGRPILPPMPYAMYRHFTDADLEAIFTYLQSIPPVRNRVPEPISPAELVSAN